MTNTKKKLLQLLSSSLLFSCISLHNAYAIDLQDALVSTYKTNPILFSERETVKSTDEAYSQALAGWFPSISATGERGRESIHYENRRRETSATTVHRLNMNQPLFNGGETMAQMKRAKHLIKSAQANLERVEQNVLLDAITAYMNLYQAHEIVKYSQKNVESLEKRLDSTDNRFSLGEVTRTDVAQTKSRLARGIADSNRAKNEWEANRAAFKRITGIDADTAILPPEALNLPATLDEAINIARDNNPQIRSIQYDALAARDAVSASKAVLLPDVSLRSEAMQSEGYVNLGNGKYSSQTALINVTVPLYQSGAEYSRIRANKNTADKRRYDAQSVADSVRETTIRAWNSLETSRLNIQSTSDIVESAKMAQEGVMREVDAGTRTTLDSLDAEQELFVAQVENVRAKRDEIVNAYTLKAALGQLTAKTLKLPVPLYDPAKHYQKTKFRPAGF